MRILILGNGYIGKKINAFFKNSVLSNNRIYCERDVNHEIERYFPEVVINCIGRVGYPNIDWCEENKKSTIYANSYIPLLIESSCNYYGVKMVHLSTGCIYQGSHYFKETDLPNFHLGVYAQSKYTAEQMLSKDILQLRIRMPIDGSIEDRNLLHKLVEYKQTINVFNSITVIPDFLVALDKLIKKDVKGIFNVVNNGSACHNQILSLYNHYSNDKKTIKEISIHELNVRTKALRSNCTLSTDKLNKIGIQMPDVMESLNKCVKEYVHEKSKTALQLSK